MVNSWRLYLVSVCIWGCLGEISAQDVHFSHIHATPIALNPAMTGVFDGKVRLISNYRNQWRAVTADYKTFMFSADANFASLGANSVIGLGAQFINDVAGDLDFTTNSSSLSMSVMQSFDDDRSHIIAAGIQAGAVTNRFNPYEANLADPEPIIFDEGANSVSYLDLSLGMLWFMKLRKRGSHLYLGASALHVNKPVVSILAASEPEILYQRIVFHGGANIALNRRYILIPNFIYMAQGPNRELTFGSFVRYNNPGQKRKDQAAVMLGAWIRGNRLDRGVKVDAIIAAIRLDYNNVIFSLSYDVNISSLSNISSGRGGPELSLLYQIGSVGKRQKRNGKSGAKKKSGIKCPVF